MALRLVESGGDDLRNAISSPNQVLARDQGKTNPGKTRQDLQKSATADGSRTSFSGGEVGNFLRENF